MSCWGFLHQWKQWARPLSVALVSAMSPLAGAFGGSVACEVPEELVQFDEKLPHLAERLQANEAVKIVVIGGASTTGLAAGSSELAYPHRLQEILARWYPSSPITVVNRGVPRQTAQQMLERFPTDVIPEDPVLVIWETGTTDAVRGVGVDDFAATLQTGIDELKAHSVDIILVDMQFSHSTVTVIDFERYLNALHRVGDVNDVGVFPRFEMMRYWSEQNVFDFDAVAKEKRASLAAKVYECIASKLAETIRVALR
jgi:GDSL-like lipase/acylhydrolase family protein